VLGGFDNRRGFQKSSNLCDDIMNVRISSDRGRVRSFNPSNNKCNILSQLRKYKDI